MEVTPMGLCPLCSLLPLFKNKKQNYPGMHLVCCQFSLLSEIMSLFSKKTKICSHWALGCSWLAEQDTICPSHLSKISSTYWTVSLTSQEAQHLSWLICTCSALLLQGFLSLLSIHIIIFFLKNIFKWKKCQLFLNCHLFHCLHYFIVLIDLFSPH